ncbi:hypothetical protein [Tardiphaga sp. vice278]|nr:hypothetical protein [Tardiphaga sp. vice278]QDM19182.1 hypothetical protein FNL53_27050 [Tardiphaga sp. vice278]
MQTVYLVTNAHVIEGGNCTARVNKLDGTSDVIDLDEREWITPSSGDDIAIFKMSRFLSRDVHSYVCVPNRMIATREKVAEFGIGPGDETVTIGRFINADGMRRNTPTVRFGNIAQMPIEPIEQDRFLIGSTKRYRQESYLVESKSISGFSGSLVFAHLSPMSKRPENKPHSWETFLLGISWGYIMAWEPVEGAGDGARVRTNTGMMGVVPAWVLSDLLMRPDISTARSVGEDQHLQWQAFSGRSTE